MSNNPLTERLMMGNTNPGNRMEFPTHTNSRGYANLPQSRACHSMGDVLTSYHQMQQQRPENQGGLGNYARGYHAQGGQVKSRHQAFARRTAALAKKGRGGDTKVALIGSKTAKMLDKAIHHGHKQINPKTGLREYSPESFEEWKKGKNLDTVSAAYGYQEYLKKFSEPTPPTPHIPQGIEEGNRECGLMAGFSGLHKWNPEIKNSYPPTAAGARQYQKDAIVPYITNKLADLEKKEQSQQKLSKMEQEFISMYKGKPYNSPDFLTKAGETGTIAAKDVLEAGGAKLRKITQKWEPLSGQGSGRVGKKVIGQKDYISPERIPNPEEKDKSGKNRVVIPVFGEPPALHAVNLTKFTKRPGQQKYDWEIQDPIVENPNSPRPVRGEYQTIRNPKMERDREFGLLPASGHYNVNRIYATTSGRETSPDYRPRYTQDEIKTLHKANPEKFEELYKKAQRKNRFDFEETPADIVQQLSGQKQHKK